MPNKNSIESEITKLVDKILDWDEYCGRESCNRCGPGIKSWTKKLNALVKKGRVEELKRNAYYSQPRKTDPLKLCGIDMTAKQVLDRLEELEG